jgi:hypothetical protein
MEAALREMRMGNLRAKMARCQQDCMVLARESSSFHLTLEDRIAISRMEAETIRQRDYLQWMLGHYEHQG